MPAGRRAGSCRVASRKRVAKDGDGMSPATLLAPALASLSSLSLRGAVALGLAALACALGRRWSAARRHAIWRAALLTFALMPAAALLLPRWRVELPVAPPTHLLASVALQPGGLTGLNTTLVPM